ncbi:MAG: response regulator transcription factor [Candidatus Hydrogenedentes bacterium]|nr:response regulator transcription factor [Candidatus Hydrogenedentota bacterium]
MAKRLILVVDDEEDILELVKFNLEKVQYACSCAATGTEAVRLARQLSPDLVLLDLMLPGLDGFEVCSILKNDAKTRHIPIIMLTAKGKDSDIVRGLELGADDYVTKPFSPKVLVARVNAALRRNPKDAREDGAPIRIGEIVIHPGRHEVIADGTQVELTSSEFGILAFLARRPGWVFTRSQIVEAVHGVGYDVTDRAVDVQIVGLRKKLAAHGDCIETVRGVGYRVRE